MGEIKSVKNQTAAAYIRVSTDEQQTYSPDSQLREILNYCEKNDIILPKEFIFIEEEGASGKSTKKRDKFNEMIAVAKSKPKPFDVLLLWKFSRFARNREDSIVYKTMLRKKLGINVVSISEPIGDEKMSVLIEALIEAMDEYYSLNLAEEVKRGMTEKAGRGEPLTIAPFGYIIENKKDGGRDKKGGDLIIQPEQAEIVKDIFDNFVSGVNLFRIAKSLNGAGVRTNRGNRIDNRFIEYILNNPVYIGKIRWNPSGRTRRDYGHPDLIISDGKHEPIVSMNTWDAAQRKLQFNRINNARHSKAAASGSHWLVGLVKCSVCGKGLVKNGPEYLQCRGYTGGKCIASHALHILSAEKAVIAQMKKDCGKIKKVNLSAKRSNPPSPPHIEKSLNLCLRRLERVKEAYTAGIDTLDEYSRNKSIITAEIERLEKEKGVQTETPETVTDDIKIKAFIKAAARILGDPDKTAEDKKQTVQQIISHIIYAKHEKTLDIFYIAH